MGSKPSLHNSIQPWICFLVWFFLGFFVKSLALGPFRVRLTCSTRLPCKVSGLFPHSKNMRACMWGKLARSELAAGGSAERERHDSLWLSGKSMKTTDWVATLKQSLTFPRLQNFHSESGAQPERGAVNMQTFKKKRLEHFNYLRGQCLDDLLNRCKLRVLGHSIPNLFFFFKQSWLSLLYLAVYSTYHNCAD